MYGQTETMKYLNIFILSLRIITVLLSVEQRTVNLNLSSSVENVLLVFCNNTPVACSGLKKYSDTDVEIKRVWVEPEYRGNHIATEMMNYLEDKAKQLGFSRMILQTREIMLDAVRLYTGLGYYNIDNYPPYDKLEGAICFAKAI